MALAQWLMGQVAIPVFPLHGNVFLNGMSGTRNRRGTIAANVETLSKAMCSWKDLNIKERSWAWLFSPCDLDSVLRSNHGGRSLWKPDNCGIQTLNTPSFLPNAPELGVLKV